MSIVLHRFPLSVQPRKVYFREYELSIRPNQLAVWVSLSMNSEEPGRHVFPALIDTGFGHTFALHAEQLRVWFQLFPEYHSRPIRFNGVDYSRAPTVSLWLFRRWSHSANEIAMEPPILLSTQGLGIVVNPHNGEPTDELRNPIVRRRFPRIPLLGMETLRQNRLRLFVDAWRSRFSLYQGRIWPWQ